MQHIQHCDVLHVQSKKYQGCRPTSFLPVRLKGLKRGPAELLPLLSGGRDAAAAEMTHEGLKRGLHRLEICLLGSRRT